MLRHWLFRRPGFKSRGVLVCGLCLVLAACSDTSPTPQQRTRGTRRGSATVTARVDISDDMDQGASTYEPGATGQDGSVVLESPPADGTAPPGFDDGADTAQAPPKPMAPPPEAEDAVRLLPEADAWLDRKGKRVILGGRICKREGVLELFACLRQTKEHESIVSINTKAFVVHAALVALGFDPGRPVQFLPEYQPAEGPQVDVLVYWSDAHGKRHQATAQEWVRHVQTQKALAHAFVFGGSGFYLSEEGQHYYKAEDGDLICVSNFSTAMLDLPINSSQSNDELLFECFTERIPPLKTEVAVVLVPKPGSYDPQRGLPVEAPDPEEP
jgi:hypothetical protein